MSDETGKNVKNGLKKGAGIAGKIIKWLFIILVIIIVLVMGYSFYTGYQAGVRDATGGEAPAKMVAEAISVSAVDLWSAYDGNAVKADSTYKGKVVRLSGKVSNVDKDIFNEPYVVLESAPYRDDVHVYFKQSEASKLADLNKGQTITIVGKCEGKSVPYVEIKDSFFE